MKCFAIKDLKSEGFNVPFFQPTFGQAERMFKDLQQDDKSTVSKYPEDFSLWVIGQFDHKTGSFIPEANPKKICDAEPKNI